MDAATMDVATIDVETTDAATTAGGGTMQRATDADDAKAQKGSGIRRQGWGTKKNNRRRSRNIGEGGGASLTLILCLTVRQPACILPAQHYKLICTFKRSIS